MTLLKKAVAIVGAITVVALAVPVISSGGNPSVLLWGLPAPFPDMTMRLESLRVPPDFKIVSKHIGGVRNGAAPPATVGRSYSAAWDDGALCDRVFSLASAEGTPTPIPRTDCGWTVPVVSGWKGRAVYVWRYFEIYQVLRPYNRRFYSDQLCVNERARADQSLSERRAHCWVTDDKAIVFISVSLKAD